MSATLLYLFLPFGVCLVLGVPIAATLALSCLSFILFSGLPIPPSVLIDESYSALNSYALLALPAFILTGELLNRSGLIHTLLDLAMGMVGWIRGGLAHVAVLTGMMLGCISGSAIADSATLGPLMIPNMEKQKYSASFAGAVTAASALIGAILPPSVPLIIIGSQLDISIGGLFLAGVGPGILTGVSLMALSYLISRRYNYGEIRQFAGIRALSSSTFSAVPVISIPVIIIGGVLYGVFTPTEAGAVAAGYTILLSMLVYRTLSMSALAQALTATARISASALLIVALSMVFGRILAYQRVPDLILSGILDLTQNKILLMILLVAFLLVMGTFMDAVANMIILGPLLMPLAVEGLGLEPFQYGIFLMYSLLLGLLTPPLGLVLFIVAPIAGVSIEKMSLAVLPFLATLLLVLVVIIMVPGVTTFLPNSAGFR
jgi:C4-dicarboxylate transporter DctM subunit